MHVHPLPPFFVTSSFFTIHLELFFCLVSIIYLSVFPIFICLLFNFGFHNHTAFSSAFSFFPLHPLPFFFIFSTLLFHVFHPIKAKLLYIFASFSCVLPFLSSWSSFFHIYLSPVLPFTAFKLNNIHSFISSSRFPSMLTSPHGLFQFFLPLPLTPSSFHTLALPLLLAPGLAISVPHSPNPLTQHI